MTPKHYEAIEEVSFLNVNPGSTFEYEGVRYVLCIDGHQGEFGQYRRCVQMDTGKVNYLGPRKVRLVKFNVEPIVYVPLRQRFVDSEVKQDNYRLREQIQLLLDFDSSPPETKRGIQAQALRLLDFRPSEPPPVEPQITGGFVRPEIPLQANPDFSHDCAVCNGPEETPKTDETYEDWRIRWTNKHQRMTWEEAKEIEKRDASRYPQLRLPTVRELVSLFEYAEGKSRAFGIGTVWASEKVPDGSDEYAWAVDLSSGEVMRAVTWDVNSILWVQRA